MSTLFVMYLLTRISHLCWSGYLYLRTSDFRNIELRKTINHNTIVDSPPLRDLVPTLAYHHEHYHTRKKKYSIDLCAAYNFSKKFIYAITGYSGATHDARAWGLTRIHQNSFRFFSSGEYLLGDAAYQPTY